MTLTVATHQSGSHTVTEGFTPLNDVRHAKTLHDHLPLPDGRKLGDAPELHSLIVDKWEIPGTDHHQGREALAAAYAAHLADLHRIAGDAAVNTWLRSKS